MSKKSSNIFKKEEEISLKFAVSDTGIGITEEQKDKIFDAHRLIATCFEEVIESEMEWFSYLSGIQEIMGFNEDTVRGFLEYYTHIALKYIGNPLNEKFTTSQNELVLFYESKKSLNNTKSLAQENNLLTYNIGVLEDGGFLEGNLDINLEEILNV